jgi:hypothetical protein
VRSDEVRAVLDALCDLPNVREAFASRLRKELRNRDIDTYTSA